MVGKAATCRELTDGLTKLAPDGPPALRAFVPGLRRLLGADAAAAFGISIGPDGASVPFAFATGELLETARPLLEQVLQRHPLDFGAFDPLCPEPRQRNAPLLRRELGEGCFDRLPAVQEVLGPCRLAGLDLLRVLVCDGDELLAWVGAFRRVAFTQDDAALIAELVPRLRHRLSVEHQLAGAPVTTAALSAALEAMGSPAFILREHGPVVQANTSGRALLERDVRGVTAELQATLAGSNGHGARFAVMRLEAHGAGSHYLILERAHETSVGARAASARVRWALTPRQQEVLTEVAAGASNKDVAATLGCAERTVELHVTALLGKAGCENRAALVAKFWREL